MSKIAIIYWTGTGNTEAMANAISDGAKSAGCEVNLSTTDFDVNTISDYSAIAFGCPSMGAEELEDTEFLPMWNNIKENIKDEKVILFGSYGWGDGEWMRNWEEECKELGINVVETYICNETPDDEEIAKCNELGEKMA